MVLNGLAVDPISLTCEDILGSRNFAFFMGYAKDVNKITHKFSIVTYSQHHGGVSQTIINTRLTM